MTPFASFLSGLLIGVAIAAPVGPIGVLCIRRALAHGRLSGFVSGLGAAVADALYGVVAAFGLSIVMQTLVGLQAWLQAGGAAFLLLLAIRIARAPVPEIGTAPAGLGAGALAVQFLGVFLLTLANPATILSFIAIFAGAGLGAGAGEGALRLDAAAAMVGGVFLGSAAWWLLLSQGVALFRHRLGGPGLKLVNLASAAMLGAFALWTLRQLLVRI
ncbi:MAG: LysE family transporter [Alphaproteobacteria bacterium]|nr:LysE family transporter [Alphaproteobacteria bacterium]